MLLTTGMKRATRRALLDRFDARDSLLGDCSNGVAISVGERDCHAQVDDARLREAA